MTIFEQKFTIDNRVRNADQKFNQNQTIVKYSKLGVRYRAL